MQGLLPSNSDLYLAWVWPDLRQKSSWMASNGQMTITVGIYAHEGSENMCCTTFVVNFIFSGHLWPDIYFDLTMTFVLVQHPL